MDQTLSLPHQTPSSGSDQARAGMAQPQAAVAEEDPESPGRSPRQATQPALSPDPLAEGMALMAGVVVALMTVLVPLATVVNEARPPGAIQIGRVVW